MIQLSVRRMTYFCLKFSVLLPIYPYRNVGACFPRANPLSQRSKWTASRKGWVYASLSARRIAGVQENIAELYSPGPQATLPARVFAAIERHILCDHCSYHELCFALTWINALRSVSFVVFYAPGVDWDDSFLTDRQRPP
jgi:hypothetical protein